MMPLSGTLAQGGTAPAASVAGTAPAMHQVRDQRGASSAAMAFRSPGRARAHRRLGARAPWRRVRTGGAGIGSTDAGPAPEGERMCVCMLFFGEPEFYRHRLVRATRLCSRAAGADTVSVHHQRRHVSALSHEPSPARCFFKAPPPPSGRGTCKVAAIATWLRSHSAGLLQKTESPSGKESSNKSSFGASSGPG